MMALFYWLLGFIVPTGAMLDYAAPILPNSGWLLCDGSAVSRTTYAGLFSKLVPSLGTFTVTIASPGVFTLTNHGLNVGDAVYFTTTGALPTGLTANTIFYVSNVPSSSTFRVSATHGGADVNTSGTQSGAHTCFRCPWGLGNGTTTFNLPDIRGRVTTMFNSGGPVEVNALGWNDGVAQASRNISHHHTYRDPGNNDGTGALGGVSGPNAPGTNTSGDANNTDKPAYACVGKIIRT